MSPDHEAPKRPREEGAETESLEAKLARYDLFDILDEEISASSLFNTVSQPELGYLLDASDGELRLQPASGTEEGFSFDAQAVRLGEIWGFEEAEDASFVSVELGFDDGGELALDGLFDYSDVIFGSTETSLRSQSTPAQ